MRFALKTAMAGAVVVLAAACTPSTTTPIQSMSQSDISVAYVNGFAGMGDARRLAREHCGDRGVETTSMQPMMVEGLGVDQTVVQFRCK